MQPSVLQGAEHQFPVGSVQSSVYEKEASRADDADGCCLWKRLTGDGAASICGQLQQAKKAVSSKSVSLASLVNT